MQEGWGSGGDEMSLGTSQWEDEDGDMWSNAVSQESSSSCSSWGSASKKGLQKVGCCWGGLGSQSVNSAEREFAPISLGALILSVGLKGQNCFPINKILSSPISSF